LSPDNSFTSLDVAPGEAKEDSLNQNEFKDVPQQKYQLDDSIIGNIF
jgi:hypothetical protein